VPLLKAASEAAIAVPVRRAGRVDEYSAAVTFECVESQSQVTVGAEFVGVGATAVADVTGPNGSLTNVVL